MARTFQSVCKLCRREGVQLYLKGARCFTVKCAVKRREYPPGAHVFRRQKISEFGLKLRETQKVKRVYGLNHRQFRKTFAEALRLPGNTGENLLQLLERRLMNVVALLGFAPSRPAARQMIAHGHVRVNGRRMDVPSHIVRVGDTVSVHSRERSRALAKQSLDVGLQARVPPWLQRTEDPPSGRVVALPTREDVTLPINENLVVEYCSR
ncbi:MAG: 30S ribosomal protein S4 [Planctomycetota bacterium]